jgi:hypothetical protein
MYLYLTLFTSVGNEGIEPKDSQVNGACSDDSTKVEFYTFMSVDDPYNLVLNSTINFAHLHV